LRACCMSSAFNNPRFAWVNLSRSSRSANVQYRAPQRTKLFGLGSASLRPSEPGDRCVLYLSMACGQKFRRRPCMEPGIFCFETGPTDAA
jgi:hypothetical protein